MPSRVGMLMVLDTQDVLAIHEHLTKYFSLYENDPISPSGVRDRGMLESAVSRQLAGAFGQLAYPTPIDNAVTLMYGICQDHPFHNGNKRTALVCLLAHLYENRLFLRGISHDDLYQLVLDLARHELARHSISTPRASGGARRRAYERRFTAAQKSLSSRDEVAIIVRRLRNYISPIDRRNYPITSRTLKGILTARGFQFGEQKGNRIELIRVTKAARRGWFILGKVENKPQRIGWIPDLGDGRMISPDEVARIRKITGLAEDNGYDAQAFFQGVEPVDELIAANAMVLRSLAAYDRGAAK